MVHAAFLRQRVKDLAIGHLLAELLLERGNKDRRSVLVQSQSLCGGGVVNDLLMKLVDQVVARIFVSAFEIDLGQPVSTLNHRFAAGSDVDDLVDMIP